MINYEIKVYSIHHITLILKICSNNCTNYMSYTPIVRIPSYYKSIIHPLYTNYYFTSVFIHVNYRFVYVPKEIS